MDFRTKYKELFLAYPYFSKQICKIQKHDISDTKFSGQMNVAYFLPIRVHTIYVFIYDYIHERIARIVLHMMGISTLCFFELVRKRKLTVSFQLRQ